MCIEEKREKIREWLHSEEGEAVFAQAAEYILLQMLKQHLSYPVLTEEDLSIEEVQSELMVFLLENPAVADEICRSQNPKAVAYLAFAFLNHLKEFARQRDSGDPKRYLRKRVLDVLRASDQFVTHAEKREPTWFSMGGESGRMVRLMADDLDEIEFPDHLVPDRYLDSLKTKEAILSLAGYFCEQVSTLFGGKPVRIELSDLVRWMHHHMIPDEWDWGSSLDDPDESLPDLQSRPDWEVEASRMADCFACRLQEEDKTLFVQRHVLGLSLEEIAEQRNCSRTTVYNRLERIMDQLKECLRDQPGLSPGQPWALDEEHFSLFMDNLLVILNKDRPDTDSNK